MKRWVWLLLGVLYLPLAQANSATAAEAQQWLNKMLQAAAGQNYQGVVVLGNEKHWDSYTVRHALLAGVEYEWVEQLSGTPRLSVRHGEALFCGHTETLNHHHHPLKNPLRPQSTLLADHLAYDFKLAGTHRVAGRWAQKINIQPHDEWRYRVNLWLDLETALLLRTEIVDQQQVLVRAQFAQIDFSAELDESAFIPHLSGHDLILQSPTETIAEAVGWQPQWLPAGFQLKLAQQHEQGVRLLYFDGLASFSVFIESAAAPAAALKKRWGATGAVVQLVEQEEQTVQVTAVGELPLQTLKKVAQSITSINDSDR